MKTKDNRVSNRKPSDFMFRQTNDCGTPVLLHPWGFARLAVLVWMVSGMALIQQTVASVIPLHLISHDSVPLTSSGYSAVGDSADIVIGFNPTPGRNLTLIRNTGNAAIQGTFSNLDHGQVVDLARNGIVYRYIADYFGESGNDLVLRWARTSVLSWGANSLTIGTGGLRPELDPNPLIGRSLIGMDAGVSHVVALASDGAVLVWGSGSYGVDLQQLGIFTSPSLPVEVDRTGVMAGKRVIAVSAGEGFCVALCEDGSLFTWGLGTNGRLGNGSDLGSVLPVAVDRSGVLAGRKVVSVSAGFNHCIALCEDGSLVGWGSNSSGQLGDFAGSSTNVPVLVPASGELAGRSIRKICSGRGFNLALDESGNVITWGANTYGQMGNGTTSSRSQPVLADFSGVTSPPPDIVEIAAGYLHAIARASDGSLWSWGHNSSGQLGTGNNLSSTTPIPLPAGSALDGRKVVDISAGAFHNLAVCDDASLVGWGGNDYKQLENSNTSSILSPAVLALSGMDGRAMVRPAGGEGFSCVITTGMDSDRLAGISLQGAVLTAPFDPEHPACSAIRVPGAASVTLTPFTFSPAIVRIDGVEVAAGQASPPLHSGSQHTLEVALPDGRISEYLLFMPDDGRVEITLGEGDIGIPEMEHVDVTNLDLSVTLAHEPVPGKPLLLLRNTGAEFIRGRFANLPRGAEVSLSFNGKSHRYVANYFGGTGNDLVFEPANRTLLSWGAGGLGRLGTGDTSGRLVPSPVKTDGALAGKTVLSIASSSSSTLALCADGTLVAWGDNFWGQLGIGDATVAYEPVAINNMGALQGREVAFIATGNVSSMAICTDRTVVMWGRNHYGVLGDGTTVTRRIPVSVSAQTPLAAKTPVAGALGGFHSVVLCSDGSLFTWGRSFRGSLGRSSSHSLYEGWLMPGNVSSSGILSGRKVATVSAGLHHNVMHCTDGTTVVWGGNGSNELNLDVPGYPESGSGFPIELARVGALEGKTVVSAMACSQNTLLLCSDSSIITMGSGQSGQLGDGSNVNKSAAPAKVDDSGVLAGRTITGAVAGDACAFAIDSEGSLYSWGSNLSGQLGDGTMVNRSRPVRVENRGFLYGGKVLAMTNGGGFGHSHALVWMPDDGFIGWMADQGVATDRTEKGDPDGDGLPNLLEYALGGDPASVLSPGRPQFSRDAGGVSFSFQRFATGGDQPDPVVQWSDDFIEWESIRIDGSPDPRVVLGPIGESGWQQISIVMPTPSGDRLFFRLVADSD